MTEVLILGPSTRVSDIPFDSVQRQVSGISQPVTVGWASWSTIGDLTFEVLLFLQQMNKVMTRGLGPCYTHTLFV